ncbi:hypothetical protein [Lacipirellula sp.]|uniref:hypothetical protein n=1 Tax=Lacipirellula sp. TaxID=2691419 RepID=UPI003D13DF16
MLAANACSGLQRLLCVLAIMAPSLAAADEATPVTQFISPDRQHIAYGQIAVGPKGEQKVRIIVGDVDGSNRRALPIEADSVGEVQWYGNDRLAYVTKHGENGYWLIDLTGQPAGELRMPDGCDSFHQQCLSPDGKIIAFCGNYSTVKRKFASDRERLDYFVDHPETKQSHGLFFVDLATQSVRQVLDKTVANLPAWSPDSKYLACGVGQYVGNYPLAIIERETGRVREPDANGTASAWSPDSRQLALVTDIVQGGSWLSGVPMDGAIGVLDVAQFIDYGQIQLTRVSPPGVNVSTKEPYSWISEGAYGAIWSPDGKRLAYRRHESSRTAARGSSVRDEIWIVQPNGAEARKVLNHGAEQLAWADDRTLLWVHDGQFGRIDVDLDAAGALGPTPTLPTDRFTVVGRVTDGEGRPLEGVEIRSATGWGTLRVGEPVTTDAAGQYELHFGPGMWSLDGGPNLQVATFYAKKPGFYERDLCAAGNLGMANYRSRDAAESESNFKAIVYPGHPYQLDFVMLPAAQVSAKLVDAAGKPLADYKLAITGEELYPASNVLESKQTDNDGVAEFGDVPLKTFSFTLGARDKIRTAPIDFKQPGPTRYRIIYDDIAGTLTAEDL